MKNEAEGGWEGGSGGRKYFSESLQGAEKANGARRAEGGPRGERVVVRNAAQDGEISRYQTGNRGFAAVPKTCNKQWIGNG